MEGVSVGGGAYIDLRRRLIHSTIFLYIDSNIENSDAGECRAGCMGNSGSESRQTS
jgi:hypothetical protein